MIQHINFSVKEFSAKKQSARSSQIDVRFLKWCISTLWERSGKAVSTKQEDEKETLKPNAVVHIDANILPEDIEKELGKAMYSKVKLIYTDQTPMMHAEETELIEEMFENAKKLFEYLPVLYSLGVAAILPLVPPSYTMSEEMEDVLRVPGDKREAQLLYQYDNIFLTCKRMISQHNLAAPPLFLSDGIDRTALVFLNKKQQVSPILGDCSILMVGLYTIGMIYSE